MSEIRSKKALFNCFDGKIAKKAIILIDDISLDGCCYEIVGKYCRIVSLPNGRWDIWICSPGILDGLSQRKVSSIIRALQKSAGHDLGFVVLDGEAFTQQGTKELVLDNLKTLGIPKKRQLSDKQMAELTARLRPPSPMGIAA